MTPPRKWPQEALPHHQRALKYARRILRLGDEVIADARARRKTSALMKVVQMRRWTKAIHAEMLQAKSATPAWPRIAENARMDVIVACGQALAAVKNVEAAVRAGEAQNVAWKISQAQECAQDIELLLTKVA